MAKRRKKRKPKRKAEVEPYPGWMWMLFGLAIGLSVAFAIYQRYEGTVQMPVSAERAPASMAAPIPPEPEPATPDAETEAESEPRFSFYSMLPDIEVTVTEDEADVRPDRDIAQIEAPGVYVLQAGSFAQASDAERRKAELAFLGVESRVQRVSIDERTFHRVRIGPLSDLEELNAVRRQLREADIDVLRIRLGD